MTESILSEVYKAREQYAASFKYDLDRIYADLKARQDRHALEGWSIISPPVDALHESSLILQKTRFVGVDLTEIESQGV